MLQQRRQFTNTLGEQLFVIVFAIGQFDGGLCNTIKRDSRTILLWVNVFECYPQEHPIYEVGYKGLLMLGLDGGIQIAQMHKYAKNIVNVGAWSECSLMSIIESFLQNDFVFCILHMSIRNPVTIGLLESTHWGLQNIWKSLTRYSDPYVGVLGESKRDDFKVERSLLN